MPDPSEGRQLAGMRVIVVDNKSESTPDDLRTHLAQFQTRFTLRALGALIGADWTATHQRFLHGQPVPFHAIPYLALTAIEASSDDVPRLIDEDGLVEAFRIFLDLREPHHGDDRDDPAVVLSMALRLGAQSDFQAEVRHQLPRIVTIFRDLWPKHAPDGAFSPMKELEKIVGISFEQILFFGWAFAGGSAKQGYVGPYIGAAGAPPLFSFDAQERFLKWVTTDYASVRRQAEEFRKDVPKGFDHHAFNPLVLRPLVRPDIQPEDAAVPVHLVPCPRLRFDVVHRGLFKTLADAGRGRSEKENRFRQPFGAVFQEYVGLLLRESLPHALVFSETTFQNDAGESVATVDWMVVEGDRCVLIEVKTSALSVPTVALGDVAAARGELRKSIGRAAKQLTATEQAIRSGRLGLEHLGHVRTFERVIITYERLHWANSLMRHLALESFDDPKPHVHVSAIEEFEYVLSPCVAIPLSVLLGAKARDPESDSMDFKNWIGSRGALFGGKNGFLEERSRRIFEGWGIPVGEILEGLGGLAGLSSVDVDTPTPEGAGYIPRARRHFRDR